MDTTNSSSLKHLKLKGLQPKTIEGYSRTIRRIGARFDHQIDSLTETQLTDYFTELVASHSWSTVKLDLYGLKFYYQHVLRKPWIAPGLIKPPRCQRLPDVVTVDEARRIFAATRVVSYRVFFFTLYSLGLRLGEGLRLKLGDIDAARARVHIRDAKGNKDRFVPLPHNQPLSACFIALSGMASSFIRRRSHSCAASGKSIATRCCCSPTDSPADKGPQPPRRHWIAVACRPPCTRWSKLAA
jgi:site-specific recombinase XerD